MSNVLKRFAISLGIAILPFFAFAQSDNSAYLASLFNQVRALQQQINILLAQLSAYRSQSVGQIAGSLSTYGQISNMATTSPETELVIADDPGSSFRVGTPSAKWVAQSFVAASSSPITGVSFALARKGNPAYPLTVSLRTDIKGADIASVTITPQNVSDNSLAPTWVSATFSSSPVSVMGGMMYYIVVSNMNGEGAGSSYFRWVVSDRVNPYADGMLWNHAGGKHPKYDALLKVRFGKSAGFQVLEPNGGEVWRTNTTGSILWAGSGGAVQILLFPWSAKGPGTHSPTAVIATSTPNIGALDWKIPTSIPTGEYFVRVFCILECAHDINLLDDSDGPFSIISQGGTNELIIAPIQGLDKMVVAGSNGVELARIQLDAQQAQENVKIVQARIIADVVIGDLDNFQSLQLFDGSTPLNTGSNVLNPAGTVYGADKELIFNLDSPGIVVSKGTSKNIILRGNLTTGAQTGDKIKFDFSSPLSGGGWLVSGVESGRAIEENTLNIPGSLVTVTKNGGWSITVAPSQPTEKWVAAGSVNVPINVLRFIATTEDFALTDLRLQLKQPATAADIAKISLWDGAVKIAEKTPSFVNGVEDFTFPTSGPGSFVILKDSFKEMTIKVTVAGIGQGLPGTAGRFIVIDFDGDGTPLGKNKALGQSSGISAHASTAVDTSSSGIRYFRSVPTLERVALPVTALTSGNHVIYKMKVTADPAYNVAVHKFTFSIATTGITSFQSSVPSFTLWNATDNRRVAAATGAAAAFFAEQGNYDKSGQIVVRIHADNTDLPSGQCTSANCWDIIPRGLSRIYELRADITTDGTGDLVTTKLQGDFNSISMGNISVVDGLGSRLIWSDFSADATTTHSVYTADWMNGFKVPGLPFTGLDSSTLSN